MGKKKSLIQSDRHQLIDSRRIDLLYNRVSDHIDQARQNVQRAINVEMIKAYWFIGREIVEEEQHGQIRAEYGKAILKKLSAKLQAKYKSGFGVDTLEQARKFFLVYQSDIQKSETVSRKSDFLALIPNLQKTKRFIIATRMYLRRSLPDTSKPTQCIVVAVGSCICAG